MSEISSDPPPRVPAPEAVQVEHLGDDLALLSYPLASASLPAALTIAEQEVALRVYAGASNEAIARERGVSLKTVSNQLDAVYHKLGVSSRAELTLRLRGPAGDVR